MAVSQEQINEALGLLSEPEQARLHELFADYQQRNYPPENISQIEKAISSQVPIKEVGFGGEHFRQYQILGILSSGIAWVRKMWGDKAECEMPISQLVYESL